MTHMTHAEAKKKFTGTALVKMADEQWLHCDYEPGEDCYGDCSRCPLCTTHKLELRVDEVSASRRSFLLKIHGWSMIFVIPKKQAATFKLQSASLSPKLAKQVGKINLRLTEEKILFCRTWHDKRRDTGLDTTYIYPCSREEANCLLVITRKACGGNPMDYQDEVACGGSGARIESYSEESGSGCDSIDLWRFRYSPAKDRLNLRKAYED